MVPVTTIDSMTPTPSPSGKTPGGTPTSGRRSGPSRRSLLTAAAWAVPAIAVAAPAPATAASPPLASVQWYNDTPPFFYWYAPNYGVYMRIAGDPLDAVFTHGVTIEMIVPSVLVWPPTPPKYPAVLRGAVPWLLTSKIDNGDGTTTLLLHANGPLTLPHNNTQTVGVNFDPEQAGTYTCSARAWSDDNPTQIADGGSLTISWTRP